MPINVKAMLRKAARELEAERARIEHQLAAIRGVLGSLDSARDRRVRAAQPVARRPRRRRMSAAARRAFGRRMKAYWAKRRATSKGKG